MPIRSLLKSISLKTIFLKPNIISLAVAISLAGCGQKEPETAGGSPQIRRLTQEQYLNSIEDIFGSEIEVPGRFEPEIRSEGLVAIGTSRMSVSPMGLEQFDIMARSIAAQVLDESLRMSMVPCEPATKTSPDDSCASLFVEKYVPRLFRRQANELDSKLLVALAHKISDETDDFYAGLEAALAGMLVSSEFLFRADQLEPDPSHPDKVRLTAYSKAQRLSFLLWNSTPDEALLAAAANGDLHDQARLDAQVDRLLASPKLERGVRAFFSDMYGFDEFENLTKDPIVFPRFNFKTAQHAEEETLRTIIDQLLTKDGDYRDLFTSRDSFLTRTLGLVYLVPVAKSEGFEQVTLPEYDEWAGSRSGILTHVSFLALHSHPGRSSATLRGKAVRELILCQKVPSPPPNVDFSVVQDTSNMDFKTARDRVTAHLGDDACAGCHRITDPIGLALENFDGSGVYQKIENGVVIDASGELDGQPFNDAVGLAQAVHDHPDTASCLARRVIETGTGQPLNGNQTKWLVHTTEHFSKNGYRLRPLLRSIALSNAFYSVSIDPDRDTAEVSNPSENTENAQMARKKGASL